MLEYPLLLHWLLDRHTVRVALARAVPRFVVAVAFCVLAEVPASARDGLLKLVTFEGSALTLRVPSTYFYGPQKLLPAEEVDSVLLISLLPDLTSEDSKNRAEFREVGSSAIVQIFIQPFENQKISLARIAATFEADKTEFGHKAIGRDLGLSGVRQVPPSTGKWHWQDTYRDRVDGEPSVAIACDGAGTVPYPHCRHHFVYDGFLIQLTYSANQLQHWKTIQNRMIEKIASWI